MTKSRTLRKAAAVALSLAMAFSVAGTTTANAAAKPSLKKTKVSVKVKKSVKVGIKNAKLVKKLTVKSKNKKVAKAAAVGKKAVKITGVKAGKTKVTVTIKYGKKTLKKNIKVTVKPNSTTDKDKTTVIKDVIKIQSDNALQSDGSVLKGDILKLIIPADLGLIQDISWQCNGVTKNTSGAYGTGLLKCVADEAGTWVAKGVTSKGTTYISNELNVTDKEAAAKIENFEILEDYDTKFPDANATYKGLTGNNVVYKDKSAKLIAHFKVNRLYTGTFGVVKDVKASTKASTSDDDTVVVTNDGTAENVTLGGNASALLKTAKLTTDATKAKTVELVKKDAVDSLATVSAAKGGVFVGGLGKETEVWVVLNDAEIARGTTYAGYFDQKSTDADNLGKGAENISAEAAAPYVKAPTTAKITNFEKGAGTFKMELQGEDGKALAWMNADSKQYAATIKACSKDNNVVATTDKLVEVTTAPVKKGEVAATGSFSNRYIYATVALDKGVYGADPITLTASLIENAEKPATSVRVTQSATEPKSAIVKFVNLKSDAPGKVYVVQGTASENTFDKMGAVDVSKQTKFATVAGGAGEVEVTGVFDDVNATDANKNKFVAIFVPDDNSKYAKMVGGKDEGGDKTDGAWSNTVWTLEHKFQKYAATSTTVKLASTGVTSGSGLKGLNQFTKDCPAEKSEGTFELTNDAENYNDKIEIVFVKNATEPKLEAYIKYAATAHVGHTYSYTTKKGCTISVKVTEVVDGGAPNNAMSGELTIKNS